MLVVKCPVVSRFSGADQALPGDIPVKEKLPPLAGLQNMAVLMAKE